MKILLAHANPVERKRVAGVLTAEGHELVEANSSIAAAKASDDPSLEVAVLEYQLSGPSVQALRQPGRRVYVIAANSQWSPQDIGAAYTAGAHDLLKLPACKEEVLGRVDGFRRMQKWAYADASRARDFTASFDLQQLQTWRDLEAIVSSELGELVGTPLHAAPPPSGVVACASDIPLVLSGEGLEVRLGIGVDHAGAGAIAQTLLGGDQRDDALRDALRELANTAGGAVKRAALADGISFTLGLPSNANLFALGGDTRTWTARGDGGLAIACAARIASIAPKRVPATQLREGMVIARDVKNAAGILLASAGTYLTRSFAERLGALAGANVLVEVSDAAAAQPAGEAPQRRHEAR